MSNIEANSDTLLAPESALLEELLKIGYERDLALQSLRVSDGDVAKAVQYCYEHSARATDDITPQGPL